MRGTTQKKSTSEPIANTHGQPLQDHLLGVAKRGVEIFLDLKPFENTNSQKIEQAIYLSGIFHDIGKLDPDFQKYIRSTKAKNHLALKTTTDAEETRYGKKSKPGGEKEWHGIFHHELSWAFLKAAGSFTIDQQDTSAQIHELIEYAVFWHHPRQDENPGNSKEILNKAYKESWPDKLETWREFILETLNRAPSTISRDVIGNVNTRIEPIVTPDFTVKDLDKQTDQTKVLMFLIDADRQISALSPDQLTSYLNGEYKFPREEELVWPVHTENEISDRTKAQKKSAETAAKNSISCVAMDPGGGKTSIALFWREALKSSRPMVFGLSRRRQVDGLYHTLQNDLIRIYSKTESQVSRQTLHSGEVQEFNSGEKPEPLDSHISILVFDRLLASFYRRAKFNEFIRMLRSDLVLDEFHEFLDLPKMIPSLKVILNLRTQFKRAGKTLLLSGTPDPSLLDHLKPSATDIKVIKRDEFPPVHTNKKTFSLVSEFNETLQASTLTAFNRIEDAQEFLIKSNSSLHSLIHSRYALDGLRTKLNLLFEKHGKNASPNDHSFVSASLLQSSFDVSFKNAQIVLSHPNTLAQYFGRIDRFGRQAGGEVKIKPEHDEGIFNPDKKGYKDLYSSYKDFLKKLLKKPLSLTHREALEKFWDKFWESDKHLNEAKKTLSQRIDEAFKQLQNEYPRRALKKSKSDKSTNSLFRGLSLLCSAKEVDDNGQPIAQLSEPRLISVSAPWQINELRRATQTSFKKRFLDDLNQDLFAFDKYKIKNPYRFGKTPDLPLLFSHISEEIDTSLRGSLEKTYRVYHKEFGLISQELLKTYIDLKKETHEKKSNHCNQT